MIIETNGLPLPAAIELVFTKYFSELQGWPYRLKTLFLQKFHKFVYVAVSVALNGHSPDFFESFRSRIV